MQISYLLATAPVISNAVLILSTLIQWISSCTWQQFLKCGSKEKDSGIPDSTLELSYHYCGTVKLVLIC